MTTRAAIKDATVPESIIWLLFTLICVVAFVIGYCNGAAPDEPNTRTDFLSHDCAYGIPDPRFGQAFERLI